MFQCVECCYSHRPQINKARQTLEELTRRWRKTRIINNTMSRWQRRSEGLGEMKEDTSPAFCPLWINKHLSEAEWAETTTKRFHILNHHLTPSSCSGLHTWCSLNLHTRTLQTSPEHWILKDPLTYKHLLRLWSLDQRAGLQSENQSQLTFTTKQGCVKLLRANGGISVRIFKIKSTLTNNLL